MDGGRTQPHVQGLRFRRPSPRHEDAADKRGPGVVRKALGQGAPPRVTHEDSEAVRLRPAHKLVDARQKHAASFRRGLGRVAANLPVHKLRGLVHSGHALRAPNGRDGRARVLASEHLQGAAGAEQQKVRAGRAVRVGGPEHPRPLPPPHQRPRLDQRQVPVLLEAQPNLVPHRALGARPRPPRRGRELLAPCVEVVHHQVPVFLHAQREQACCKPPTPGPVRRHDKVVACPAPRACVVHCSDFDK
mmetsp:Transcript_28924/g.59142  ORF Transcript_28924/g.59142 Transcript_28924/m.59142 type:complete len:246 (-) Transcript_28924:1790-2527(-)